MSVQKDLKKKLQKNAQKTIMQLMADDRTRPMIAKAMQTYMESRQKTEAVIDQTASSLGLASQQDVKAIKTKLRKLERQIDQLSAALTNFEKKLG